MRKKRILLYGTASLACLGIIGWLLWSLWQHRVPYLEAARRLDATTKEAHALGIPLSVEELQPRKGRSAAQNAAEDYRRATLQISASGVRIQGAAGIPVGSFVLSGGDSEFLQSAQQAIKLTQLPQKSLFAAFQKEYCDFELDYKGAVGMDSLSVVDLRPMNYVFGAQALFAAQKGDVDTALSNIRSIGRMRQQLVEDPAMARALLSVNGDSAALVILPIILEKLGEKPEVIAKTRALLPELMPTVTFEHVYRADLYSNMRDIELLKEPLPRTASNRQRRMRDELLADYVPVDLLVEAYQERLIRFWINAFESIRKHPNDPIGCAKDIDQLILDYNKTSGPADEYASRLVPSNHWNVSFNLVRQAGLVALIESYLRITEFKLKNGRLPNDGEIKLAEDPFTGEPVAYRRTNGGYNIFCQTGTNPSTGGPAAPLGLSYPGLEMVTFGGRGAMGTLRR